MIYFSGFSSQPTSTESQIHGVPDRLLKLCATLHSTFLKKLVQIHRFSPAFMERDVGIGGVCLPDDYVNAESLGLQLELESAIFQVFHAYLLPAMGLSGL